MTKFLVFVILVGLITSCVEKREGEQKTGLLSNFVSITDNEDKGVNEILNFYGGYCKYALGASVTNKEGKKKYFELELSKSEILDRHAKVVQMPASNIAYLFYKNLNEERDKYDEIQTVLIITDGEKSVFKYSTKELQLVEKRMRIANKVVNLIKHKTLKH